MKHTRFNLFEPVNILPRSGLEHSNAQYWKGQTTSSSSSQTQIEHYSLCSGLRSGQVPPPIRGGHRWIVTRSRHHQTRWRWNVHWKKHCKSWVPSSCCERSLVGPTRMEMSRYCICSTQSCLMYCHSRLHQLSSHSSSVQISPQFRAGLAYSV